jgi:type IV pilus assembly protein PilW
LKSGSAMNSRLEHPSLRSHGGLTLVELLVALLIAAFLIIGLVQIVMAARGSFQLQENQAEVQENGRYAVSTLGKLIRQTGYSPQPWNEDFEPTGLMPGTQDRVSSRSDRLTIRSWSNTNCFDNRNPVEDGFGEAAFFLRESSFDLNDRNDLTHTCRYGPTEAGFTTQIRHQGFVRHVEMFQALFGLDDNGNGHVNRWVKAAEWADQQQILGIKIGLLLRSTDSVVERSKQDFSVLDADYTAAADGRLRLLLEFTAPIKGRSG